MRFGAFQRPKNLLDFIVSGSIERYSITVRAFLTVLFLSRCGSVFASIHFQTVKVGKHIFQLSQVFDCENRASMLSVVPKGCFLSP